MLKDKVAIVTGSNRGIGQAIAVELARHGAKVVLVARNIDSLKETETLIRGTGNENVLLTQANVTIGDEVAKAVKKALDTYGRVDILVNNAGVTRDNLLALMSDAEWDDVLLTNLKSVFLFTKAVTRPMVKQRSGSIINIASVVGITGNAGQSNYAASKAGMIGFTKSVAKELAKRNIRANVIAPGFIQTRMTGQLGDEQKDQVLKHIALGRFGEPKEIADVAVFLASDSSKYMTGQTLVVDGGLAL